MDGTQHCLALKFAHGVSAGRIDQRNVDFASMKSLIRLLLLLLPLVAAAQSQLPKFTATGYRPNFFGLVTSSSGQRIVGEFRGNRRSGQGAGNHIDRNKYGGDYKDSKPNGQGAFSK